MLTLKLKVKLQMCGRVTVSLVLVFGSYLVRNKASPHSHFHSSSCTSLPSTAMVTWCSLMSQTYLRSLLPPHQRSINNCPAGSSGKSSVTTSRESGNYLSRQTFVHHRMTVHTEIISPEAVNGHFIDTCLRV